MPFGCSASLRSLSCCLQFLLIPHGSSYVLQPASFICSSYASLHHVRRQAICLGSALLHPHRSRPQTQSKCLTQNPTLHYSLGFISLLRHFFISAGFSPPAALFSFARRPPHLGCVHLATANCSCRTSISQSSAKVHLHSSAASVPCREIYSGGFLWSWHRSSHLAKLLYINPISGCSFTASPFVGARRHFHSFLIPVPYGGSPPKLQCGQVCRTAMLLFCRRRFYRQANTHLFIPIHPTFAKILSVALLPDYYMDEE